MRVIDILHPFFQLDLYYYVVSMHFTIDGPNRVPSGALCLILPSVANKNVESPWLTGADILKVIVRI